MDGGKALGMGSAMRSEMDLVLELGLVCASDSERDLALGSASGSPGSVPGLESEMASVSVMALGFELDSGSPSATGLQLLPQR